MRQDHPIKQTICKRAARKNIPVCGTFELTPRCSLNCKMCYIRMTPEQMKPLGSECSIDRWIHLAQEARDMGLAFLLLTGGEPFLRQDIFELLSALNTMGIVVDINSNGPLINETVVDRLLRTPPSKINITLYGASRETYEKLCGDGMAFDRVVDAIDLLRQAGILVCLNATLTPDNLGDLEAMTCFALERGLVLRTTAYVMPPSRRGVLETAYRLPSKDAGEAAFRAQLLFNGEDAMKRRAISQLAREDCYHDTGEGIQCLAGRSQFWISWNGMLLPCGMLPQISADLNEMTFREGWARINEAVCRLPNCKECVTCADRMICPGCAASRYCENGNVDASCAYMCEFSQSYRACMERLAKEELR